ncbi:MAG: hypothetical protein JW808_05890, partial [Victivallales bacterium]|nr:hypothetical protein [Victivallales bacterium]
MKNGPIISGAGVVSPIGNTFPDYSDAIFAGDSAIMEISSFDHSGYDAHLAAEALDFDLKDFLKTPKNYLDRNTALAFGAMCSAIQHSGLDLEALDKSRVALAWGTDLGSANTMNLFYADIQTKGPRFGKPILFPHAYSNTTISLLSIEFKISGPHINFASGACASSQAIAFAAELVENGEADIAIAGGSEAFGETA